MHTRQVGTSGLRVSRLGLGTMTWGRDTSARDVDALFGAVGGEEDELTDGDDPTVVIGGLVLDVADLVGKAEALAVHHLSG